MLLSLFSAGLVMAEPPKSEPDAVIERWDQAWTAGADGTLTYHERKDVRINSDRAHGEFADPRITFNADTQKVNVITARTRLPDGKTVVDVPEYSRNEVSPSGPAGWPAFANIHQLVLTFSAIEPGSVVELEYEVTTAKGAWSEYAGDVRLDHRYPIKDRNLALNNPARPKIDRVNMKIARRPGEPAHVVPGEAKSPNSPQLSDRPEVGVREAFGDMDVAQTDEPQCPPWQTCRPRYVFSANAGTPEWVAALSGAIDAAAKESPLISKLASEWSKSATDPGDKIRALQEKLAATFNFVDFPIVWRNPRTPRKAADALTGNYGVPEEATAVLLSLARADGLFARPALLVSDDVWRDGVFQDGLVSAFVLLVDTGAAQPEIWHPQFGRITRDKRWAGSRVLAAGKSGVDETLLAAWTDPNESTCRINGAVTLGKDGVYTAKLRLRLSGLCVSRESLRTADQQKARAADLLGRLVPNSDINQISVRTLTDTSFDADVDMKSRKPLTQTDGFYRFAFAQDSPLQADIPLPLTHATRTQPVRLTGAADEQIELMINYPAEWNVESAPGEVAKVEGGWGAIEQSVKAGNGTLTLTRHTRFATRDLAANDFLTLRGALNQIRSEWGRTLLLRP